MAVSRGREISEADSYTGNEMVIADSRFARNAGKPETARTTAAFSALIPVPVSSRFTSYAIKARR
jgi:hypothetical protein